MKKLTLSLGIEGSTLTFQLSPDIREQTIFFNTLKSLIMKNLSIRDAFQSCDSLLITTSSPEQSNKILVDVYALCQRMRIIFEPLTLQSHKLVEQLKTRKSNFENCRKAAVLARGNALETEFHSFKLTINQLLTRKLREYQYRAAFYATKAVMSCNFSVPGSGKTTIAYAAYAFLNSLPENNPARVDKILVIGPISSFQPWQEEFDKCFGDKRKKNSVVILDKSTPSQINTYCRSMLTKEITVVNYEKVRRNAESFRIFLDRNRTMLVVDEVHRMKNPQSQTSMAIRKFNDLPNAKLLMTGTPMPNGYEDLFTQFSFLWPDNTTIGFTYDQLRNLSKTESDSLYIKPALEQLLSNISPYFVRITKQMLALPSPESPIIQAISLTDKEQELYSLINQSKISINPNDLTSVRLLRAKALRLMQATTNPKLLKKPLKKISFDLFFSNSVPDDTETEDKDSFNPAIYDPVVLITSKATKNHLSKLIEEIGISTKIRTVLNLINELVKQGNKVIVWTIFIQTMQDLSELIHNELGFQVELLNGMTKNLRVEIIDKFKHSSDLPIVIANPSAVSESISLHTCCHHAIYLDMSYNAVHYVQSKDRIHRLGLAPDTKTFYYYLQAKDTIDERVYKRVTMKEIRMNQAIENELPPILQQASTAEIVEDLT